MSIRSYFKPKDGLPDSEGLFSTCLPTQVVTVGNKAVEKAIVDKVTEVAFNCVGESVSVDC